MSLDIHHEIGGQSLECSLCSETLTEIKQLSCTHIFCADCFAKFYQCQTAPKQLLCPVCNQIAGVKGAALKRKTNVKGKASSVKKFCSVCAPEAKATAVAYCETCKDYMCTSCVEAHGSLEMHKLQRVVAEPRERGDVSDSHQAKPSVRSRNSKLLLKAQQSGGKKWRLDKMSDFVPSGGELWCATPTADGRLLVGFLDGGIEIFSPNGPGDTRLGKVKIQGIAVLTDGRYVVRDGNNSIALYSTEWKQLPVSFHNAKNGGFGGMAVDKDNNIYVGCWMKEKIEVFKPTGGGAIRTIACRGYEPWEICPFNRSSMLLVAGGSVVAVVNESGKVDYEISSKTGGNAYPLVLHDESILIAWDTVGRFSISLYTKYLKYVRTVFEENLETQQIVSNKCCLREFTTGQVAFCDFYKLSIFKVTSSEIV